ncbi:putative FAD binding domain-containing protein [Rosellinia necatrix]|uniref:Delta(24)-sterol reductase n=1 Tax=Rosellinia necatrix TaxID=77044 RepID=A0A1W2TG05_ROSNE|nr:putative FAD binding domain-containing protein [Rosellinia necatrix]
MERHQQAVRLIAATVRGYFEKGVPFRIAHGSTNSTRPAHLKARARTVDIGALGDVLEVDTARRVALVEPNVPMDRLVERTLRHGLVPPVVMEFPGITAGGGFAGTAGESSSFRHGYFDESVDAVEMVLPDGEVVVAKPGSSRRPRPHALSSLVDTKLGNGEDPEKYADLFHGAAGAVGTLGITTLLELRLVEARRFVRTTYRRTNSVAEAIRAVREECAKPGNDYVDGILFSEGHGVVVSGELTDELPPGREPRTFSHAWDPWYYMHVREVTEGLASSVSSSPLSDPPPSLSAVTEYIPLAEYLFRYDRGGFWVGQAAFDYFRPVPFSRFFRWLLDDFLHTRMLYRALHASGESARFFVQDLGVPYDNAEAFIAHTTESLNIWPLWLCPLKTPRGPSFHPHVRRPSSSTTTTTTTTTTNNNNNDNNNDNNADTEMLNVGVWGWGPQDRAAFVRANRALEAKVASLGGMKWLYAHTYYSEPEFWAAFGGGRAAYEALRAKYRATGLPSVYDKVKVHTDDDGNKGWKPFVKSLWPVGGLYGIWRGIRSRDYLLHRHAAWRWPVARKQKTE